MLKKLIFLSLIFLSLAIPAFAETYVGGAITTDTTWTLAGSPYIVTSDISVYQAYGGPIPTLTIVPGVEVKFQPTTGMYIGARISSNDRYGALNAQGTQAQPIKFTSNAPTPSPGDWKGIYFRDWTIDGTTILDYCIIEYGGYINEASKNSNLYFASASPTITNSTIQYSSGYGAYADNGSVPTLTSNTFINNSSYPISSYANNVWKITQSTGSGNNPDGIEVRGGDVTSNATWAKQIFPYIVTSDITVRYSSPSAGTATLTIQPGVEVKFQPATGIYIGARISSNTYYGALIAQGTEAQPITFTSNAQTPAPGDWKGIHFRNETVDETTILNHCTIEYGGNTHSANLYFESASPTITNSTISHSSATGITLMDYSTPSITFNTISYNGTYGIYSINATPYPDISFNEISNNGFYPAKIPAEMKLSNNVYNNNANQAIEVIPEEIKINTVWPNETIPYIVTSDITVRGASSGSGNAVTLTIEPGVEVKFQPGAGIYIGARISSSDYYGALNAQGTLAQPITFTSNASTPAPGDWKGIYFRDWTEDGLTILDYCIIEYGGYLNEASKNSNLYFASASPAVINSTIQYSSGYGIYCNSSSPSISNSSILNSGSYGVYADDTSAPNFISNTINNSVTYPISIFCDKTSGLGSTVASGNNPNAVELRGGNIDSNTIWPNIGYPYVVTSSITIYKYGGSNITLTIEPGVEVRFAPATELRVGHGAWNYNETAILIAQGTAENPIIFTSNASTPAPGDWKGIVFDFTCYGPSTILDHCIVEYAGNTNNATIYFADSYYPPSPTITNSVIRYSSGYGIYSSNNNPSIHYSNIINNTLGGINNVSSNKTVYAQYNWWGDASGPSGAGPGTGQWISSYVEYEPWLGEAHSENFYFYNVAVSPKEFSQNGGWTTFHIDISEQANWTITIKDQASQIVRTFSGTGTQIRQDWYGDDQSSVPLPNGTYAYYVSAESVANPGTFVSLVSGKLILNNTLPIAKITLPQSNTFVSNAIQIRGTASCVGFSSYKVEYGIGEYPVSWTTITTSSTPVVDGVLTTFDTTAKLDKVYTFRLTVTDTSQKTAQDFATVKILSVYNLSDSIDPFSPDIDGIKDNTVISANFTYPTDWQLDIKDPLESVVKTFNGSGNSISQLWDGTDNSSITLPDAQYSYQLRLTEPVTLVTALSMIGASTIDNTQPTASITSPATNEIISGTVLIVGTANDLHFESYKVEYGVSFMPTSWITIKGLTTTPVINGTLATWDVFDLAYGNYTIRLTVNDTAGNISLLDVPVVIDNIQITNISVNPTPFNPFNSEVVNVNYTIDRNAQVSLEIYDLTNNLLKTFGPFGQSAGSNSIAWDGRNESGQLVANEKAYTFHILADSGTRVGRFIPDYITATVPVSNFTISENVNFYNNELCQIDYTLADNANVLLRAGNVSSGPYRTIVNWNTRSVGQNTDFWNGRDDNGNILDYTTLVVAINTSRLPDLPIIVMATRLQSDLSIDPYSFIPSFGEITNITFDVPLDGQVSLKVYDPTSDLVKVLLNDFRTANIYQLPWDGTDSSGTVVSEKGNYRIELIITPDGQPAITRQGNVTVY